MSLPPELSAELTRAIVEWPALHTQLRQLKQQLLNEHEFAQAADVSVVCVTLAETTRAVQQLLAPARPLTVRVSELADEWFREALVLAGRGERDVGVVVGAMALKLRQLVESSYQESQHATEH